MEQQVKTEAAMPGGMGGRAEGDFNLTAGTTLNILVGQQPTAYNSVRHGGGGGGGTFVVTSTGTPLIIAGGGSGGGGTYNGSNYGNTGGNGGVIVSPVGYTEIASSSGWGDGGGGGLTLGGYGYVSNVVGYVEGGRSFTNGGAGGFGYDGSLNNIPGCGGFGGGGGGGLGGGGGGGAQGGGSIISQSVGACGGTSYNTGTNQTNTAGANSSGGSVTITSLTNYIVTIATNGPGSAIGGGTVQSGNTTTLTATPSAGSSFVNWTNNIGNPIVTTPTITTPAITDNTTYTANFIYVAPATPTNITASSIAASTAVLSWDAGTNDTSYKIYQNTILVGTSNVPNYTALSLKQSTLYSFTVSGYNVSLESDQSLPCLITTTQTVNSIVQTSTSQTLNYPLVLTDGVNYYDPITKQIHLLTDILGLSVAKSANEYTGATQAGAIKIMILH